MLISALQFDESEDEITALPRSTKRPSFIHNRKKNEGNIERARERKSKKGYNKRDRKMEVERERKGEEGRERKSVRD